jgi:phospholipase/lecithinase/hemolysin
MPLILHLRWLLVRFLSPKISHNWQRSDIVRLTIMAILSLQVRTLGSLALIVLLCGSATAPAFAATYDNLYVFGDSNSDTGTRLTLEGLPLPPYWEGRHSNGPVAVEYLSAAIGVASQAGVNNFAVGGAFTGYGNIDTSPSLTNTGMLGQFEYFSNLYNNKADPNALYFLWGGGNDITACGGTSCTSSQLEASVTNLNTLIGDLSGEGALHFVMVGSQGSNSTDMSFNSLLAADVSALNSGGTDISFFNPEPVVAAMRSSSNIYGFTHRSSSDPCYTGTLAGTNGTVCSDPDAYVTWDTEEHLTAHANQILGDAMAASILTSPVPEPETYAMLMAGLGLIGFVVTRKNQA